MEGLKRQVHKTKGTLLWKEKVEPREYLGALGALLGREQRVEVPGARVSWVEGRPGCAVGHGNPLGAPGGPGREQEEA